MNMVNTLLKTQRRNRAAKHLTIPFSLPRRILMKYKRLPLPDHLQLSILKLDGSSFSIPVGRNDTVAMVKTAIREELSHSMDSDDNLWSVVWSHFCLCNNSEKLLNDKAKIKRYAIKDGDQLHFVQHLRIEQSNEHNSERLRHALGKIIGKDGGAYS